MIPFWSLTNYISQFSKSGHPSLEVLWIWGTLFNCRKSEEQGSAVPETCQAHSLLRAFALAVLLQISVQHACLLPLGHPLPHFLLAVLITWGLNGHSYQFQLVRCEDFEQKSHLIWPMFSKIPLVAAGRLAIGSSGERRVWCSFCSRLGDGCPELEVVEM